jgi:shikimate kinase / 3-dehydroquinate synthase
MGAGKSTLGPDVARRLGRSFVSTDALVEETAGATVEQVFVERGEAGFRVLEEDAAAETLERRPPSVVELGGGAVMSARTQAALAESAFTVLLDASVEESWERVAGGARPLAQDAEAFRTLHAQRSGTYAAVADAKARDADGVVLAASGAHVADGGVDELAALVPDDGPVELVVDENVERLHGARARTALGDRLRGQHVLPAGERAKTVEIATRVWSTLRLDRSGTLVVLGGGGATDLGGFVAATYLRGISWTPVPTTLVGQVDAAIGGKVAIDLTEGKNLVGVFHWPSRVVIDRSLLETLPEVELANGLAEVVKTGLLAGEPLWERDVREQVRRCAAFKAAVCLRDPHDQGERAQLNLGHTFAHALEAGSGYELPHGRAVALGLVAALRLSGLSPLAEEIGELLDARPVAVDRDTARAALLRDKKAVDGETRLVLLARPGEPRVGVRVPDEEVRAALDALIE